MKQYLCEKVLCCNVIQVGSTVGSYGSLFQRIALSHLQQEWIPFDQFCASLKPDVILKRTCRSCNLYFPSQVALKTHARSHKKARISPIINVGPDPDDDPDDAPHDDTPSGDIQSSAAVAPPVTADETFPVVRNLFEWLQSAFINSD